MAQKPRETFHCPNCDAEVKVGARACPECGSDDQTGWSGETMYDDLDLPSPGYGKEDEPEPEAPPAAERGPSKLVVVIMLLAIGGLTAYMIWRRFRPH